MKKYQIKTYNLDGSYKATINEKNVINEITFSSNINWWVWQLSIQTDYPITDTTFQGWEYVKVVLFDDYHKSGKQIFYWFISQIIRSVEASREYTTFVCLWVNSLLNSILYTNWSYTKTPSTMIKDVLTFFQNQYNCIIEWTIDATDTWNQNYKWNYVSCFDIIKSVAEWVWKYFIVDWDGILQFFQTWKNHFIKLHYDIEKMSITNTIESVVNNYLLNGAWSVGTYTDATSQTTYWRKDRYEENANINSTATRNTYWNQYITDNKNPKEEMTITLNSNYPFEDILPWDTITILNAWIEIDNKQINKIKYNPDKCVLTISKKDTLWNVIK